MNLSCYTKSPERQCPSTPESCKPRGKKTIHTAKIIKKPKKENFTNPYCLTFGGKLQVFMSGYLPGLRVGTRGYPGNMTISETLVHDAGGAESRKSVNLLDQHITSLKSSAAA